MKSLEAYLSLKGKVAVVTGGRGILGHEFVNALRLAGAKVAVIDNKKGIPSHSTDLMYFKCDITKKKEIQKTFRSILFKLGSPSVLVNCAAIDAPPSSGRCDGAAGLLESESEEAAYDDVIDVNVKGTILCCQVFGNHMEKIGGGSIINISSIYGRISPDQRIYRKGGKQEFLKPIAYCVSKACIPQVSRYFATYFKNVRVNTLTFGGVFNNQDIEFVNKYSAKVPLGRMANRSEYCLAVLSLASDSMSYMTGADVVIDGGYTVW
jgi:NAD(P)-dependent dehydrogenase (short-subunit alcohol dehydrogenase family)